MNSYSINSILAKMATHLWGENCRYPVYTEQGLFKWQNPDNAFRFVADNIEKCSDSAQIILFGSGFVEQQSANECVLHSFILDNQKIIDLYEDKIAVYCNDGYKLANVPIGQEIFRVSVSEFKDLFKSNAEHTEVEVAFSDQNYEAEALAFIYCAYVIFKYVMTQNPKEITKESIVGLSENAPIAQKFLTKYKVGYRLFSKLLSLIVAKKEYNDQVENLVLRFGKDLKGAVPLWTKNNKIGKDALTAMKAFGTYLRKRDSNNAKNWLLANVNKMQSRTLVQLFSDAKYLGLKNDKVGVDVKGSQQELLKKIKAVTKKLIGSPVEGLSIEQAKKARDKDPETYKIYLELRRALVQSSSAFLRLKVRQSGKQLVPYDKTIEEMNAEGIKHNYPEGFKGYLDEDGFLYTTAKKKISNKPASRVSMNPNYDANKDDTYVFTIVSPTDKTKVLYFRTDDFAKKRTALKSEKVSELGARLKTIRNKWTGKIGYKKRENLVASILELIYLFAARVGKTGNMTGGEPTFGMSTILVKHVKKQGKNYIFAYPGKKGTIQNYTLTPKHPTYAKLAEVLDHQMQGKKPTDSIWTYKGVFIPKSAIDSFWKSLDSATANVGVHKIRNAEATKMAKDILSKHPFKSGVTSQAQVEKWYKDEMKKVGQALQHQTGGNVTSTTAIKSYIDAELQKEFFLSLGLRVPSFVPQSN